LTYTNHLTKTGEIFRVGNIIKKLNDDKKIEPLALFIDPLSSRNYNALSKHPNIYRYFDEDISNAAKKCAKKLYENWKKISVSEKKRIIVYDGKSAWPYAKYAFNVFMSKQFLYLTCLYYEMFNKAIIQDKVKTLVITATNGLFEKCAMAAAKKQNIPVLVVQHGMGGFTKNPEPICETKFLIFSEKYIKRLEEFGVKRDDIFVTGPIIFDDVTKYSKKTAEHEGTRAFLATTPAIEENLLDKDEYFGIIKKIFSEIQKKKISLTVKLHPREIYFDEYIKLTKKYPNVKVTKDQDRDNYYSLVSECDIFLHFNSSAALEAMMLGKPVVNIMIFKDDQKSFTKDCNCSIEITGKDDIGKAIDKAFDQKKSLLKNADKFLEKSCGKVDGKSYQRVCETIYKLAK